MNYMLDMIHKSNKKYLLNDLKCCGETPDYVFRPAIFVLNKMPSLSIKCDKCNKEKTMYLNKSVQFHCKDPILSESIKILKSKWNEND